MKTLRMDAYYYGFYETGAWNVDRILSAVAWAGKAFHGTDQWNEDAGTRDWHRGETPVAWIQNAANDAAAIQAELIAALQRYIDEDETNEGMEGNEPWLETRDKAIAIIAKAKNGTPLA